MTIHVRDNRGGNWSWFHNLILDTYGEQLGAYGIATYICLCRHAGQDQTTWVGQRAIQKQIGASESTVRRALKSLQELGLIAITEQADERGRATNIYELLAPPASEKSPPVPQNGGGVSQIPPPRTRDTGPPQEERSLQFMNKTQLTRPMGENISNASNDPHTARMLTRQEETADARDPRGRLSDQTLNGTVDATADQQELPPTPRHPRGRPPKPTPYVERVIADLSRELHDEEHTRSNVTRAMRLLRACGLDEQEFVQGVYEARDVARRRGNVRKEATGDSALRNRMPYLFAVLEDLLGLREPAPAEVADDEQPGPKIGVGHGWPLRS